MEQTRRKEQPHPSLKRTCMCKPRSIPTTEPTDPRIRDHCKPFIIDNSHLEKYKKKMMSDLQEGLAAKTHEKATLSCLNTYVQDLPDGTESGKFLALDLGGTNFRVLLIELNKNHFAMRSRIYTISQAIMVGTGVQLFDHVADCLAKFMKDEKLTDEVLPLGFTFSWALKQTGLTKGIMLHWTKGFNCSGVVGNDVVQLLKDAIARRGDIKIDICAILNDTTGTLISCAWKSRYCQIGIIIGTGTNACYAEKYKNVEIMDEPDTGSGIVLINTEWGAFGDDGGLDYLRTPYDIEIDKHTVNPGKQLHEKMISGMYLGEVVRLILEALIKEGLLFGGKGSEALSTRERFYTKYVSEIESDPPGTFSNCKEVLEDLDVKNATDQDCTNVRYVCECASRRAAFLVSAGIATLLNKIDNPRVTVGIDGSLYRFHPHFHHLMMEKISELVNPGIVFDLMLSEDGSGRGAALIAAVATRKQGHA